MTRRKLKPQTQRVDQFCFQDEIYSPPRVPHQLSSWFRWQYFVEYSLSNNVII